MKLLVNTKNAPIGQLLVNRLEDIRWMKECDINPLSAAKSTRRKNTITKEDDLDHLILNAHSIELYPGNDALVGEDVWIWSKHLKWYDAKVTKIHLDDTANEDIKIVSKKVVVTTPSS